jgi:rRNA processing protein Gar1
VYLLGHIKGLGYDGKLIVSGEFAPKLNLEVMDKRGNFIGKISRVFGPVASPYIAVRPPKNLKPSFDIIGTDVYVNKDQRFK